MSYACSLVLALVLAGCSNGVTGPTASGSPLPPTDGDLRLVNATQQPLAFFAIAADLAPLLDPVPEVRVGDPDIRLVLAGDEQPLGEVPGRAEAPQGGVAVYLYALTPDGTRARFTRVELVLGADIRRAGGRIVIRQLQL